jgi:hypothetical protein
MAMSQKEATAALEKTNEVLVKIGDETESLLAEVDKLEQALEDAEGSVTPELEAAVKATAARAHAIDELVADVAPPETGK